MLSSCKTKSPGNEQSREELFSYRGEVYSVEFLMSCVWEGHEACTDAALISILEEQKVLLPPWPRACHHPQNDY